MQSYGLWNAYCKFLPQPSLLLEKVPNCFGVLEYAGKR